MPGDWFAQNAPPSASAAASGDWFAKNAPPGGDESQKQGYLGGTADIMADQAKRALGSAWDYVNPLSLGHAIIHLPTTLDNAFKYTSDAVRRIQQAASKGDVKETILSGLGAIPLAGPQFEQIGREIDEGKYPEAIGHAAGLRALAELGDRVPAAREGIAKAMNAIPTASVKDYAVSHPGLTKAVGTTVGGAVGHAMPFPGGTAIGGVFGREIAKDWLEDQVKANPPAAAAATGPVLDPALDEAAQAFGYRDFASVKDPKAAQTIQKIAIADKGRPAAAAAAPPAATAPSAGPQPPPEAPPAASPAATPPPPSAPAAPASAAPPAGAIVAPDHLPAKLITEGQLRQWATDNGLAENDAEKLLIDQNTRVIDRPTLNRTLHAIAGSHEALKGMAGVDSLTKLSDEQMLQLVDRLSKEQAAPAAQAAAPRTAGEPDLSAQLEQSIAGARARRGAAASKLGPPAPEPGQTVTLKNGKTVTVTTVRPNGTFEHVE